MNSSTLIRRVATPLVAGLTAATLVLGLPATAVAQPTAKLPTTLTLQAAVSSPGEVVLEGQLLSEGTPVPGAEIQAKENGVLLSGESTTNADGEVTIDVPLSTTTGTDTFQLVFAGNKMFDGSESNVVTITF